MRCGVLGDSNVYLLNVIDCEDCLPVDDMCVAEPMGLLHEPMDVEVALCFHG